MNEQTLKFGYYQSLISGVTRLNGVPVPLFEIELKKNYIIKTTKYRLIRSYQTDIHNDQSTHTNVQ